MGIRARVHRVQRPALPTAQADQYAKNQGEGSRPERTSGDLHEVLDGGIAGGGEMGDRRVDSRHRSPLAICGARPSGSPKRNSNASGGGIDATEHRRAGHSVEQHAESRGRRVARVRRGPPGARPHRSINGATPAAPDDIEHALRLARDVTAVFGAGVLPRDTLPARKKP
jgi:hypothetical protein